MEITARGSDDDVGLGYPREIREVGGGGAVVHCAGAGNCAALGESRRRSDWRVADPLAETS